MKRLVWFPVSLCLLCVLGVSALLAAPVAAEAGPPLSSTPDKQVWITNGAVNAIATAADGTTYIGGDFTYVGPNTGSGAALVRPAAFPTCPFRQ